MTVLQVTCAREALTHYPPLWRHRRHPLSCSCRGCRPFFLMCRNKNTGGSLGGHATHRWPDLHKECASGQVRGTHRSGGGDLSDPGLPDLSLRAFLPNGDD